MAIEQKCCFKGCVRMGLPPDGFDFYVCEECGEELDRLIQAGHRKKLMEQFPDCRHCTHPGIVHDDEFGNCRHHVAMGWSDGFPPEECECPGYEALPETEPVTHL